ncbi:hypothetical protein NDU88_006741 [Pleurodeles waltl]|uniref:Uncharacterized protein n=1 Tax=Pleurodeles waltl TaxID=8319 RepID=A0AAV7VRH8_PLEWA|nr:hypothetical protein NDU88_006741 [Pleurodeles waltl]
MRLVVSGFAPGCLHTNIAGALRTASGALHCTDSTEPGVQAQRRAFLPTKRLLSQAGIGFALLYPAKLRVRHEGKVLYFSDPKQATKFARRLPKQPGAGTPGGWALKTPLSVTMIKCHVRDSITSEAVGACGSAPRSGP